MYGIMRFELAKILCRRLTKVLLITGAVLTIIVFGISFGVGTASYDQSGEQIQGIEAIQHQKELAEQKRGRLTDEKIQEILQTYNHAVGEIDRSNQEEYTYDLVNSEYYKKVIIPDYPFYEWLASVYAGAYSPVTDLRILNKAADEGSSFYEAREKKFYQLLYGINEGSQHSKAEIVYWEELNERIEEPYEYGDYSGWKNLMEGSIVWWAYILIIGICIAPVFSYEHVTKFESIMLSSKYGRTKLVTAKILMSILFGTMVYVAYSVLAAGINFMLWGIDGWDLPVQIYSAMVPYPLSFLESFFMTLLVDYIILVSMIVLTLLLSSKLLSSFYVLVILAALAIVPQFLQYSVVSSVYNHLLVLLPGQASLFANILQQYMSYEIGEVVLGLPVMIGMVYFVLLVTCVFMLYRRVRKLQVS